jgi:UDP-glucose 4-epimerase
LVLRTSRFFPEEDDMAHAIAQSDENTKANEFLFRRLTVEDAAESHVVALARAPEIGFDTFIVSALTPFSPADCEALIADAPSVVARYFPDYRVLYASRGWTMFDSIDRVYDSRKAAERLGFTCATGFREILDGLGRK